MKILIIASRLNAIGLIIPIAFVRDSCKKNVNISPKRNIEITTPSVTISPIKIIVFPDSFFETLEAIIDKNPG